MKCRTQRERARERGIDFAVCSERISSTSYAPAALWACPSWTAFAHRSSSTWGLEEEGEGLERGKGGTRGTREGLHKVTSQALYENQNFVSVIDCLLNLGGHAQRLAVRMLPHATTNCFFLSPEHPPRIHLPSYPPRIHLPSLATRDTKAPLSATGDRVW
jgi:hypothetical protein